MQQWITLPEMYSLGLKLNIHIEILTSALKNASNYCILYIMLLFKENKLATNVILYYLNSRM